MDAAKAEARLERLGLSVSLVGDGRGDQVAGCVVVGQSAAGKLDPEEGVELQIDFPLLLSEIESAARSLARKSAYPDSRDGIDCAADIVVFDEGDTISSQQKNVRCN